MSTRLFIWICVCISFLIIWSIYIDEKRFSDRTSEHNLHQPHTYPASARVKRTASGKDIYVIYNPRRIDRCGSTIKSFETSTLMTVEMRNVEIKGLPNILPPTYPIVQICKSKKI